MTSNSKQILSSGSQKLPQRYCFGVVANSSPDELDPEVASAIQRLGQVLARLDIILVTIDFSGIPYTVAQSAKQAKGYVIGYSQAASRSEHISTHKRAADIWDVIVYSGRDFANRNLLMLNSLDGLIILVGHEAKIVELSTPILVPVVGVLQLGRLASDEVQKVAKVGQLAVEDVVIEDQPQKLVQRMVHELKHRRL